MIRIKDVEGVPVVSLKRDRRAGYVEQALFDEYGVVKGLEIESKGGLISKRRYIPLNDILKIDKSVCVIYSEESIQPVKRRAHFRDESRLEEMLGRNVIDREGKGLGYVKDMIFNIETGYIEGFELSKGIMEDMLSGRKLIFLKDGVEFGEEYIVFGGTLI